VRTGRRAALLALLALLACAERAPFDARLALDLEPASALEQAVQANRLVPTGLLPAVRAVDVNGRPVPGQRVRFTVTRGSPTVAGTTAFTNEDGVARLGGWFPGTVAGVQQVTAVLANNSSDTRVVFSLRVQPWAVVDTVVVPDSVRLAVGDSSRPIVAGAVDQFGNVVDSLPLSLLVSDDTGIVEVTASGALRGVAEGRTVLVAEFGLERFGVLAVIGAVESRNAVPVPSHTEPGVALACAPTGLAFAVHFAGLPASTLYRFDPGSVTAQSIAWSPGAAWIIDGAFSPDASHAYFITNDGNRLIVVSAATNATVDVLELPHAPQRVGVTPDGTYVIATGSDHFTRISTATLEQATFPLPWTSSGVTTNGIAFEPATTTAFFTSRNGAVLAVDYLSGAVLRSLDVGSSPQGLALDPEGNRLFVALESAGLRGLHAATLEPQGDSPSFLGAFDVKYDVDRDAIWVTRSTHNLVERYTRSLLRPAERIAVPTPRRLCLRPDGSVLVSADGGTRLIPAP
jgi:DNA-binding beta-propeller fold protein YncE